MSKRPTLRTMYGFVYILEHVKYFYFIPIPACSFDIMTDLMKASSTRDYCRIPRLSMRNMSCFKI